MHVKAKHLDILRDGKSVVEALSFALAPGDVLAVTGPVASGKSSLGEVLAGQLAYGGCLTIEGSELSQMAAGKQRRRAR